MLGKSRYVLNYNGKWNVVKSGAKRASFAFPTRKEALAKARSLARKHRVDLFIFGDDGRVKEHKPYSEGRLSPKA